MANGRCERSRGRYAPKPNCPRPNVLDYIVDGANNPDYIVDISARATLRAADAGATRTRKMTAYRL